MDKLIYTRTSESVVEEQAEALKKMAISIGAVPSERSGSDAMSTLLEKVASGEETTILVTEINRLASSPDEAASVLAKLKALGAAVIEA